MPRQRFSTQSSGDERFRYPTAIVLVGIKPDTRTSVTRSKMGRYLGYGIIVLGLMATLGVNLYTLAQVARARTSVPFRDQWEFVRELARHERGEPLGAILWSPFWGHRFVIARLLFLADARWFSLASLTWITVLLQFVHIALLIALAWLLLGRRWHGLFIIAITVILNLMLSPFQVENFVWGMQIIFPLVYVAATGAFLCLSLSGSNVRASFLALCIAFSVLASYAMANGALIWPVLVIQAIYLRQSRKVVIALTAIGTVVIVSYLWHYARPLELGLGAGGMIRHPIDTILLLGLIFGSPFHFTIPTEIGVGILALAVAGYLVIHASLSLKHEHKWLSALFAIILFIFLSALSIVAGRLTPEYLHFGSKDPMPSRYFTMICLYWVSMALLALTALQGRRLQPWLLCIFGIIFACLMFRTIVRQLIQAEDWADVFLGVDAVGSAMLLDVPDEQMLSVLWLARSEREERTLFLQRQRLAIFHEPRATWLGKRVSDLSLPLSDRCRGAIEKTEGLDKLSWRVWGWAWDTDISSPPDDILFTDATGRVIGLARGGLRHGYLPGFPMEPEPVPPSHSQFRHSEWLGYVGKTGDIPWAQVSLYGLFRNKDRGCAIR
jgi:hypothetical protein